MFKKSTLTLTVLAGTGLAGCTLLYPRFDSLLNPDIAFLNAGEVVDSVRCAVTTFFLNHRSRIETDARIALQEQIQSTQRIDGSQFCPKGAVDWTDLKRDPKEWRLAFMVRTDTKKSCRADPSVVLQANAKDESVSVIVEGVETGDRIRYKWEEHESETQALTRLAQALVRHADIRPRLREAAASNCNPIYHIYKYIRFEELKNDPDRFQGRCVPNGGCRPGTFFQEKGKCALDDAGKQLVIDPDSSAKIEIGLTAVNTSSMNYQRIDATRLDILGGILVPAGVSGAPFPALKATDKKTNKVEIAVLMPQGRVQEEKAKGFITKLVEAVEIAKNLRPPPPPGVQFHRRSYERSLSRDAVLAQVRKKHADDAGDYTKNCEPNSLKVNYLGLADYIDRIVTDQESKIYRGAPEISLENFVLTSQFQISFDASAGTGNLLRIVPVLQPPVLQLSPDHTHQLKITFRGTKGRQTKAKALSIVRKCLSRLENELGTSGAEDFCRKPEAILLESLIEAVEDNASSSSAN